MEIDVGRLFSTIINVGIIFITVSSIIKGKNNKTNKKNIKSTTKPIKQKVKKNEKNPEVFQKNDLKNKKSFSKQKSKSFDKLDDFLGRNIRNAEETSEYLEDFLGNVEKNYYKEEEKFIESVFGVESVKQKAKVLNTKNNMKQNVYKTSSNISKEIDDLIYDYEKDTKTNDGYNLENNILDYNGYDMLEDNLDRENFVFDARNAVIYSEILQKPLSLR